MIAAPPLVETHHFSLVLAVDGALRRELRNILGVLGAHIHEAFDCWDIMSILLSTTHRVDLVVSDFRMLRTRGLDVLVWARAAGIDVPFLFVGNADPETHALAIRLGAQIFDKPPTVGDVRTSVHQVRRAQTRGNSRSGLA